MNSLISDLMAMGAPYWLIGPLLFLLMLTVVVRTVSNGVATVIKAMHPGESVHAVTMQENRLSHRRWKAQRRDTNRRERAMNREVKRRVARGGLASASPSALPVHLPAVIVPTDRTVMLTSSNARTEPAVPSSGI